MRVRQTDTERQKDRFPLERVGRGDAAGRRGRLGKKVGSRYQRQMVPGPWGQRGSLVSDPTWAPAVL